MKKHTTYAVSVLLMLLSACSISHHLRKNTQTYILNDASFAGAHIGICLFDAATHRYLYNYQGEKYFIPASNTKLAACYAGMKYLGDSLLAATYKQDGDLLVLQAAGDPTFLHPDFKEHPLMKFLSNPTIQEIELHTPFASEPLGRGWAWDDYAEGYMAERDPFPIFGNMATFVFSGDSVLAIPHLLGRAITGRPEANKPWDVSRNLGGHFFNISANTGTTAATKTITIAMDRGVFDGRYLADTLHKLVTQSLQPVKQDGFHRIYSQPTDSLLSIMMHRSDNFFAEQTLLMVSQAKLGVMSDAHIVDTLLKTDFASFPQKPKWVDGSGLSRYNLFTPQDLVWLLTRMEADFGIDRIKRILPTGGEGTLSSLYHNYRGRIYAKTGTLSNHVALSGFLFTRKKRMLIFSFLVNNHQASALDIRKAIEKWITGVLEEY